MTHALKQETVRHNLLRDELLRRFPSLVEDESALIDTLDGISDLKDGVLAVMRSAEGDELLAGAITERVAELNERKARLLHRAEVKTGACLAAMQDARLTKCEFPDFTVSLRAVPQSVVITDEALVPAEFKTTPEPKVSKSLLAPALKAGRNIPGACLSNGGVTLSVRKS